MKKLLGILFCFGFLLFAGITEAKAQTEPVNSELRKEMYVDVEQSTVNSDQLSAKEYKLIDVAHNRFAESFAQADYVFYQSRQNQLTVNSDQLSANRYWLSMIKHKPYISYSPFARYYPFNYQNKVPKAIWLSYFSI